MTSDFKPQTIYIDEDVLALPFSKKIQSKFSDLVEVVKCPPAPANAKVWYLSRHRGKFLRFCPGTRNYLCCNYLIINILQGCPFSCSYCALQTYEFPYFNIFANVDEMFAELEKFLSLSPGRFYRIGTGEFTDSLAIDDYIDINRDLINYFSSKNNSVLELKTKSDNVEKLLSVDPKNRIIVSWSLNTPELIHTEEKNTPALEARLAAAKKCSEKGYWIGFHFDPIINHYDWEKEYVNVIEKIFEYVEPDRIAWISLGALRFVSGMEERIRRKTPETKIIYGELLPGMDNKMRYFKPIRIEMFRKIAERIKQFGHEIPVYLCMESPEVWEKALGWRPENNMEIDAFLCRKFK